MFEESSDRPELIAVMYTQNKFLFCGITENHYTKQKQVPSKVYSVRCVGCLIGEHPVVVVVEEELLRG